MPVTAIAEPIVAGLIVAMLNRYVINNPGLFSCCSAPATINKDVEECSSSSSTTSYVDVEVHPHVHMI